MQAGRTSPTPKVSVIIPTYKTADLIATCLDSVFAQTYSDFVAMVVNDGSPDTPELERVLQPYMDRIVYIKQENKRAAGARNNAIRQTHSEFVAFLDSDDTWMPDHLSSQMQLFTENPSLDLVYCDAMLVYQVGDPCKFMERNPSNGEATFEALIVERCQIPISTVVARKQALLDAGLFDENLPRCDDYDMWVRTAFSGAKIAYSRNVGANLAADRPGSLSQSRARMIEGYWNILEKFRRTLPLKDSDRVTVDARAAEIRARYLLEEGKCKMAACQFEEARELITEADKHFQKSLLSPVLLGLSIAPRATAKLMPFWTKIRTAASA